MQFTLEVQQRKLQGGQLPEAVIAAGLRDAEARLARHLSDLPILEVKLVEIDVGAHATAEELGERIYKVVMGKVAARKLTDGVPELVEALKRLRGDMFGASGQAAAVAVKVKHELDEKIDHDFNATHDPTGLRGNTVYRYFRGIAGNKVAKDALDHQLDAFVGNLTAYSAQRGVQLVTTPTTGVPEVVNIQDDPTKILYKESPAYHKLRHEAVHLLQLVQARATVLGQLLDRRKRAGLPASGLHDLGPEELAEAQYRLNELETSLKNYSGFELTAGALGGSGGRKLPLPSEYGGKLKKVTSMWAEGLSKPDPRIHFGRHFGVLPVVGQYLKAGLGGAAVWGGMAGGAALAGLVAGGGGLPFLALSALGLAAGAGAGSALSVGALNDTFCRLSPHISSRSWVQALFLALALTGGAGGFALAGGLGALVGALTGTAVTAGVNAAARKTPWKIKL